jgi:hypothetical protein
MTHPYSIFIWQALLGGDGEGCWEEPVQVSYEDYALYLATIIHKDSRAVIKVVRYGLTIASFPDEETMQRIDRHIAQRWPHNQIFTRPR